MGRASTTTALHSNNELDIQKWQWNWKSLLYTTLEMLRIFY